MDMGLKGTVAIAAASSDGLGKAAALELAREGANVVMFSRDTEKLTRAAAEISEQTGAEVLAIPGDVTKDGDIKAVVVGAADRFGRIDILVTNAGGPPPGTFMSQSDDAWRKAFELNLLSVVRLIRACEPHLRASGRGRIINFSSTAVKQPIDRLVLSNAVRSAVIGLAKTLAVELAPYGITVNNIAPGRFDTARIRQLDRDRAKAMGTTEEEARQAQLNNIPLARYGDPAEMAYLVAFLASDKAAYITGTTIQIDGGMVKGLL